VLADQAERRNQAVDGLPNGVTAASQRAMVPCCLARQGDATRVKYRTPRQRSRDLLGHHVVSKRPEALRERMMFGQPEALPIEFRVQPVGSGMAQRPATKSTQMVVIDNHHT
jgi:hypothetical protein